jgi:hypothetical protein
MATTILTGRALTHYLAQHQGEAASSVAGPAGPVAATEPASDSEDALAEVLYVDARADNPGNTTEISREDILAALSATQAPPHAA